MKVLQINCEYKTGSTGKIVDCLNQGLKKSGNDVYTCYGLHKHPDDGESECICSPNEHRANALLARITGVPYGGWYKANKRFERIIAKFRPDIVHVHCINGYTVNIYNLLYFLGTNNIKTVVTLHAEFFFTGGCSHSYECTQWIKGCKECPVFRQTVNSWFFDKAETSWKKMYSAFSSFKPENITIVTVSPWLKERASQSAILGRFNIVSIGNGVNTDVFKYIDSKNFNVWENNYKYHLLFVTAYFSLNKDDAKGGKYLVELAKLCPDYCFYVVARKINCTKEMLPKNVVLYGSTNNQKELATLYSKMDCSITFGKRETFSMIVAESLCCGTPVVGFKAGGPESIGIPIYSDFVDYGDIYAFKEAIERMVAKENPKLSISVVAKKIYADSIMVQQYIDVYKKLIKS